MTMEENLEHSRNDAFKKDKRSRLAQAIFLALIVVALAGLLIIGAFTLDRVSAQLAQQQNLFAQQKILLEQQKANTDELKKNTAAQLDRQAAYIRCLVEIFAKSHPGTVTVDDLDSCSFHADEPTTVEPVRSSAITSPPPPNIYAPAAQTNPPPSSQQPQPNPPSSPQAQPNPQQPPQPASPSPAPKPNPKPQCTITLFGLCLPGLAF